MKTNGFLVVRLYLVSITRRWSHLGEESWTRVSTAERFNLLHFRSKAENQKPSLERFWLVRKQFPYKNKVRS